MKRTDLSSLTKKQFEVYEMVKDKGMTISEIAKQKKVSVQAVYKIVKKIKEGNTNFIVNQKDTYVKVIDKEDPRYKRCCICGYNKVIHKHHIIPKVDDGINLIPVCPNCHSEIHFEGYTVEMMDKIKEFIFYDTKLYMELHNKRLGEKNS